MARCRPFPFIKQEAVRDSQYPSLTQRGSEGGAKTNPNYYGLSESLGITVCPHTAWMNAPRSLNLICWIVAEPWFLAPAHKIIKPGLQSQKQSDKERSVMRRAAMWLNRRRDTVVQWRAMTNEWVPGGVCVSFPSTVLFSVPVKPLFALNPQHGRKVSTCAPSTMKRQTTTWFRWHFDGTELGVSPVWRRSKCRIKTCRANTEQRAVRENAACWRILIVHKMWWWPYSRVLDICLSCVPGCTQPLMHISDMHQKCIQLWMCVWAFPPPVFFHLHFLDNRDLCFAQLYINSVMITKVSRKQSI